MKRVWSIMIGVVAVAEPLCHLTFAQCEPYWDTSIGQPGMMPGRVHGLAMFDDKSGSGSQLFACGFFGVDNEHLVKWSGQSWIALPGALNAGARSLCVLQLEGKDPQLIVAGSFSNVAGVSNTKYIAAWDGANWSALGAGMNNAVNDLAMLPFADQGKQLFAVGAFTMAGDKQAHRIARWDGTQWHAVGDESFDHEVWDVIEFDDGQGGSPTLYCAGDFLQYGNTVVNHIARWNGEAWEPVGSGTSGRVFTLAQFDDGSGSALFAGGEFNAAGGIPAEGIAKWDGKDWSPVGAGVFGRLRDLVVFDDGVTGPALYAGGSFDVAGRIPVGGFAKWNGKEWSTIGAGVSGADGIIKMLGVIAQTEFGACVALGGEFTIVNGIPTNFVSRLMAPGALLVFTSHPEDQIVLTNASVSFETTTLSDRNVRFQWFKDGVPLIDGPTILGSATSQLQLLLVEERDSGEYWVNASVENCSIDSTSATLTVVDCQADVTQNNSVDVDDLLIVIALWGQCDGPPDLCQFADVSPLGGNGVVNVDDLLTVINGWGDCR